MNRMLTGLIAATFTPMDGDGRVRLDPVGAIVERLLAEGVTGFYVCGSTGEGPSLSSTEREVVAEAYVKAVAGRAPVVVQVGHNSLEEARRLAAHAACTGADAISAVPPSYFKPRDLDALLACLGAVAEAAPDTPFYYYHIPVLSGVVIDPAEFLQAAPPRIPTIAGIKYSSPLVHDMQRCLAVEDGRFNVLFGVDEMLLSGAASGCHGAVGSTYNFMAPLYRDILRALETGDLPKAQRQQHRAAAWIKVMAGRHGAAGLKTVMGFRGNDCGPARLPLGPVSPDEVARLRRDLEDAGFFAWLNEREE